MVDRQQHLFDHRGELLTQLGLRLQYVRGVHPRRQRRHQDLCVPPIGLGLRDPAKRVAVDTERSPDHIGVESLRELELDDRDDLQLILPDLVIWTGLGETDRLAEKQQEVKGDVLLAAHIPERHRGQTGEPIEHRLVEEIEREITAFDRLQERVQGQA